ncbi:hypothetical protein [Kordia sp.]|uniref:hypothetical protein n=1 Tax=Kordia sp. TaxID=1965332 RepID=UPI0025C0FF7F|nr:hypothetical protein [Kordia sp.]MCH2196974.1 hypothetical protein [Kordia sp.]
MFQNCKHFAIDALEAGHTDIPWSGPIPSDFAKPGSSWTVYFTNGEPDKRIANPLPNPLPDKYKK